MAASLLQFLAVGFAVAAVGANADSAAVVAGRAGEAGDNFAAGEGASLRALEKEVLALRTQLAGAERRLHAERVAAASAVGAPPPRNASTPPPGAYLKSCTGCVVFGETLACTCRGPSGSRKTSIAVAKACDLPLNITNEAGFLTCDWKATNPPPRVGAITLFPNGSVREILGLCRLSL